MFCTNFLQFECLMQLICLACSSFKKVFKASISDLRSPVEAAERATEEAEAVESVERGYFIRVLCNF